MDLPVGSHSFSSSESLEEYNSKSLVTCAIARLHRSKSAVTMKVERGESIGVTELSSLAIARNGDLDGTGGGRLEALKIGDQGA
jgi:hypothetical protein